MKRIKRLTFLAIAGLVVFSFFGQYAETATAPGIRDDIGSVDSGLPSGMAARGSFFDQIFKPTTLPEKDLLSKMLTPDFLREKTLALDVRNVEHEEPAAVPEGLVEEQPLPPAPETTAPAPDGGYCDANFVGQPIVFNQMTELTLDDLLSQIHN